MSIAKKLTAIAENQQMIYEAGEAAGYSDALWEAYQDSGNRTDYTSAFSGKGWTDGNYKPKYIPRPTDTGATYMYRYSLISEVNVDFSAATTTIYAFADCPNLAKVTIVMGENAPWVVRTAQNSTLITDIMVSGVVNQNFIVTAFDLTRESLLSIIAALYDRAGNGETTSKLFNMGSTNTAKLTAEELAQITAKGWTYA